MVKIMVRLEVSQNELIHIFESISYDAEHNKLSQGLWSLEVATKIIHKILKYGDLSDAWKKKISDKIADINKWKRMK